MVVEQKTEKDIFVVAVGASAGGLEALETFFYHCPSHENICYVIIQHLSPVHKSLMTELLSKKTVLKVKRAEDKEKVRANYVYLMSPGKNLTIHNGVFLTTDRLQSKTPNLSVDIFFRSLAQDKKDKAIAVVLSGSGSDGTSGIRMIKEYGGMVMAQDPDDAKFSSMPNNSIRTGLVDYVLLPHEMPSEIIRFIFSFDKKTDVNEQIEKGLLPQNALSEILKLVQRSTNIDFSNYRENTLLRRIKRRISVNNLNTIEDYLAYLEITPNEPAILQREFLISVTSFFRDEESFAALKTLLLEYIIKIDDGDFRVWVTACATGEEAYSIAITINECMLELNKTLNVKIFATDIDKRALDFARKGAYPESLVATLSSERLEKNFIKDGENYQISQKIRKMIVFSYHNVVGDPPFNRIDFVSCRNMLIYMNKKLQDRVFEVFSYSLLKGGVLFLGSSETIPAEFEDRFTASARKERLFKLNQHSYSVQRFGFQAPTVTRIRRNRVPVYTNGYAQIFEDQLLRLYSQALTEKFELASLLVDTNCNIIHIFGDVNPYLKFPSQKNLSWNVMDLAVGNLGISLVTAINKAVKDNEEVFYKDVLVEKDEKRRIDLSVKVVVENRTEERFILIVLQKVGNKQIGSTDTIKQMSNFELDEAMMGRISDLEGELQISRENLQTTIEELQTSNEELLSANEELQSTNEELQSLNEELNTVNAEHQAYINRLSVLNDDLTNLLNNINIGIIFLDGNLKIRRFNAAVKPIVALKKVDFGRSLSDFSLNIPEPKKLERDIEEVFRTLQPKEYEINNLDGEWFLLRIIPHRSSSNVIEGILLTFINIESLKEARRLKSLTKQLKEENDERKRAEDEIAQQKAYLTSLLNNLPIFLVSLDKKGRISHANGAFFNKNLPEENLTGKLFQEVFSNIPGVKKIVEDIISGESFNRTLRFDNRNFMLINKPMVGREGAVKDSITLFIENSELVNVLNQLEERGQHLKLSNDSLEHFIYMISHDLKEPLRNITGFTQLLARRNKQLGPESEEYMGYIIQSTRQMHKLIDGFQDYIKFFVNEVPAKPVNLRTIVDETLVQFSNKINALNAEVKIIGKPRLVVGSDYLLKQVFQNLLSNALKFAKPNTSPKIEIEFKVVANSLVFSVKDKGVGISQSFQDKIFILFKQEEKEGDGAGLGLAIVHKIVESHNGTIQVVSKKGNGAKFIVTLPLWKKEESTSESLSKSDKV